MDTLNKIKEIVVDYIGEDIEITPESTLSMDLGLTSLDIFGIANQIEDEFGIQFNDSELSEINTVADLIKIIEANQN